MAQKKKPYLQPPFDPRITTFPFGLAPGKATDGVTDPGWGGIDRTKSELTRGFIRQTLPMPGYTEPARLFFLYNPTTVTANYAIQTNAEQMASMINPNPDDTGDYKTLLDQSVSLSLLFDRTYELWDRKYIDQDIGGVDVSKLGVGVDVLAMMQLVGMDSVLGDNFQVPGPSSGADQSSQDNSGGGSTDQSASGSADIPIPKASQVMRALQVDAYISTYTRGVSFHGVIQSWNVSYTHFSQFMIPSRCVINLDMMLLPPTKGTAAGFGGITGSAWGLNDNRMMTPGPNGYGGLPVLPPGTRLPSNGGGSRGGRSGR